MTDATPYTRALDAVAALAPEDVMLLMRALLAHVEETAWPALFDGCDLDVVERFMLALWLGLDPEARVEMLGALVERGVEARIPPAAMLTWARWVEACLGPEA